MLKNRIAVLLTSIVLILSAAGCVGNTTGSEGHVTAPPDMILACNSGAGAGGEC